MQIKLKEAAAFIDGKIFGNEEITFSSLAKIEEAQPGDLTFLYHQSYEKFFKHTKASAILVKPGFNKSRTDITYVETPDPNIAFAKLIIRYFNPELPLNGIDKSASIHKDAKLGSNVSIGKNAVISGGCKIGKNVKIFHNSVLLEDVEIGDDCIIFQNVSIREKCIIGNRVIIHAGAVIGSDGFGYYNDDKGAFYKIPQIGNVIIEDDVEIGANSTIDRAAIGSTVIKRGVKIDNLVQIAHNVVIDEDSAMAAQSGVAGSTKIGKHCLLAGQVGVIGHIEIADNVILYAQSGVSKGIPKGGTYFGSPSKEVKTALKLEAHMRSLPEYAEKIKKLEEQVRLLQEELKKLK
ncbi:MAG: UDP-3-O-(3-hydroxymyristoyl)glucosamine N-acyltransferase [Ignavibacteria bacterium]